MRKRPRDHGASFGAFSRRGGNSAAAPEERPSAAFRAMFNGPELWASPTLWQIYQTWLARQENKFLSQFKREFLTAREEAKKKVDAWPSPFKNAKKGELYEIEFDVPEGLVNWRLLGLVDIGLSLMRSKDLKRGRVSGEPNQAGDFEIIFEYITSDWAKSAPFSQRKFRLIVNPDPKDLWEDHPSDPDREYARPDSAFVESPEAQTLGASRRGRSHAHKGLPLDDAFALGLANGWRLLAVADGAGSAEFSRRGSELACDTAIAAMTDRLASDATGQGLNQIFAEINPCSEERIWQPEARKLTYGVLAHAAFEARKAILAEAQAKDRDIKAYASTLLLAAAKRYARGWAILSFQIGDGAMAMFEPGRATLLAEPDEGEYGGQTRFVTMGDIYEPHELMRRVGVAFVPDLRGLLLLTDGISDPRFGSLEGLNNAERWLSLYSELEKLTQIANGSEKKEAFHEWLGFWDKGNHDDRAFAMLRLPPPDNRSLPMPMDAPQNIARQED